MNYIPGFSNYLRTSVPRYAIGGRVMDGERMMYDEPMMYDTRGYSEPYQYTPPLEQYMPVEQPMMYDMGNYGALPYDTGGGMLLPPAEPQYEPAVEPMTQEVAPSEVPFDPSTLDFSGLDLSGLDSLYGMNFGSNFGGGAMGGIYPDDPNLQYISAPLSNKGNATSQTGGNTFAVRADQPVRLVDHRTNQIVFEGTGFDAARKATELGQGLTDQFGRKANYSIQTADPTGNYSTVAYEKKNKSTLGQIANVAGTVLPLAMMAIPGVNAALLGANFAKTLGGQLAFGALTGGASSALKGQNVLKGAALGGLTAAGGALIPKIPAIGDLGNLAKPLGTGIGATVGGLATGQSLKNSLLGGAASGALAYAAPGIQESLGIGQGAAPSTGTGGGGAVDPNVMATVTGYTAPSIAVPFSGAPSGTQQPAPPKVQDPYDGLKVIGGKFGNLAGVDVGNVFGAPTGPVSAFDQMFRAEQPATEPVAQEEPPAATVTGREITLAPFVNIPSGLPPEVVNEVVQPPVEQPPAAETPAEDIIKVTGERLDAVSPNISIPTSDVRGPLSSVIDGVDTATGEIVAEGDRFRNLLSPNVVIPDSALSPEVLRAVNAPAEEPLIKVTGRQTTTPPVLWGVEKPLPDMTQPAEADKKLTAKDIADYLRLAGLASSLLGGLGGGDKGGGSTGTIPAGMGGLSSLFSKQLPPSTLQGGVGGGALPASTLASQGFNSPQNYYRYGYGPEQSFFDYATQGAPNTSRAYTGYEGSTAEDAFAPQPMRVATPPVALPQPITTPIPNNPAGPSMYAPEVDDMRFARGGFAVEGAGDGRDDKIPALLSDGEYVIDAETVALLGNGSNKAGAKLLDGFRVKVRKQKGKKLARGKFSDNAKRPEHYLAGGKA